MEDNIKSAIKLLNENGYAVRKLTKRMLEDCEECEASGYNKECMDCSCSVCIIQ